MKVTLYGAQDTIPFPDTNHGRLLQKYFDPIRKYGSTFAVENAQTTLGFIQVEQIILPYTIAALGKSNSYVCAPQSHYIDYAYEELTHVSSVFSRIAGRILIPTLGLLCKLGSLNKTIMVNNWLLSTNLYPQLPASYLPAINAALCKNYPEHSIIFRSLDLGFRAPLKKHLADSNFSMVMSRRVHIVFKKDRDIWRKNNIKNDQRLQRKTKYQPVKHKDFKPADFPRIQKLYNDLYVDKYSHFNPKFSVEFLLYLWENNIWDFQGWKFNGQLDAVTATFAINGVRTAPLIGYDTKVPQKEGLYRLAYLDMLEAGRKRNEHIHCSAGVAAYKQGRGAQSFFEYNALYDAHLPFHRRLPWNTIRWLMDNNIAPMMLKQNL